MKTYIYGAGINSYDIGELCQFTFSGAHTSLHPDLVSKYSADFGSMLSKTSDLSSEREFVGVIVDKEANGSNLRLVVLAKDGNQPTIIKYYATGVASQIARDTNFGGTAELTRGDQLTGGTAELTRKGKATGGTAELTRGDDATGGTAELTR